MDYYYGFSWQRLCHVQTNNLSLLKKKQILLKRRKKKKNHTGAPAGGNPEKMTKQHYAAYRVRGEKRLYKEEEGVGTKGRETMMVMQGCDSLGFCVI